MKKLIELLIQFVAALSTFNNIDREIPFILFNNDNGVEGRRRRFMKRTLMLKWEITIVCSDSDYQFLMTPLFLCTE